MDEVTQIIGNEKRLLARMLSTVRDVEDEGDCIGPYCLIECIGEGGFGMVWRAEQSEPVQRQVALKIIKRGMDTGQVLARFDHERQALASMDHPCIAAMLDAGASTDGRPWFAMELVQGQPLTEWSVAHAATLAERLRLFTQVCQAIHHAHQKGLIHRDLKPSNILVTRIDGEAVPKVIDFGIAKAISGSTMMAHGTLTQADQIVGTPVYMSPEQIDGVRAIDTRSDIYALGVLLYELLTGEPPFGLSAGIEALKQSIREHTPARPSHATTQMLKRQKADTRQQPKIPSDLDWITMRALEKDPDRRYASAIELAEDVQRFLDVEPVHARPPSLSYVSSRWIKRHRILFAAVCTVIMTMIAATIVSLREAAIAHVAQSRAEQEAARATHHDLRATQTSGFVMDLLDRITEEVSKGRNPEALKLALEGSSERIASLGTDPGLRVELLGKVSDIYGTIGEHREHISLLKIHADEIARLQGPASEEALNAELEHCKAVMDHGDRSAAPALVLDLRQRVEAAGMKGSKFWFEVQRAMVRSWLKQKNGPNALAEAEFMVETALRNKVAKNMLTMHQMNLVFALELTGDFDRAEAILEEIRAYAITSQNAKRLKDVDDALLHVLWSKKDHTRAAALMRARLPGLRDQLGAESPAYARKLIELAEKEEEAKELEQARSHITDAIAIARQIPDQREVLFQAIHRAHNIILSEIYPPGSQPMSARALAEEPKEKAQVRAAALKLSTEALTVARAEGNSDHLLTALLDMAKLLRDSGDWDKAEPLFKEHIALTIEAQDNARNVVDAMKNLCVNQTRQGHRPEAMQTAQRMWNRMTADPLLMQDKVYVADIADHALHSYAMLRRVQPDAPEPPDYAKWKNAAECAAINP